MTSQRILEEQVIAQLFTEARTHKAFLDKPVETATLHRLYDIAKFAPSASNLLKAAFTSFKLLKFLCSFWSAWADAGKRSLMSSW